MRGTIILLRNQYYNRGKSSTGSERPDMHNWTYDAAKAPHQPKEWNLTLKKERYDEVRTPPHDRQPDGPPQEPNTPDLVQRSTVAIYTTVEDLLQHGGRYLPGLGSPGSIL